MSKLVAIHRLEGLAEASRNTAAKKGTVPYGVLEFIADQIDLALKELEE